MNALSDRRAFVAGGSRGIGAAIVRRLAKDGATVGFTYASSPERAASLADDIAAEGGAAFALEADSADPVALRGAVQAAAARLGGLDIVVNNAGILIPGLVDDYDLADFDRMVAVNVRAGFVAAQSALPFMQAGGRIVIIGSIAADRSGFPGSSVYSLTKGAVAAMTRGLARDLGPRGITVNNVQPGPTGTEMTPAEGRVADLVKPLIALGRLGRDEEIASFVAYLAGPEAGFITGASLTIDGGFLA